MFSHFFASIFIMALLGYTGNILMGKEDCDRIHRAGSIVRVLGGGIGLVAENWAEADTKQSIVKNTHQMDIWFQKIAKRTIWGNELVCAQLGDEALDDGTAEPEKASGDKEKSKKSSDNSHRKGAETPILPINPEGLPSLPDRK